MFGEQFSEYTIGVVVSRDHPVDDTTNENKTMTPITPTKTKMRLQLGLTQRYTLKVNDTTVFFTIQAYEAAASIVIQVIELVGKV